MASFTCAVSFTAYTRMAPPKAQEACAFAVGVMACVVAWYAQRPPAAPPVVDGCPRPVDSIAPVADGPPQPSLEFYKFKDKYYQKLGEAWDHEVKAFVVLYRPMYHCSAKSGPC